FNKMHPSVAVFMNWSGKTTEEVVKKHVKDKEFITFFTVLWTYYGLPPKQLSALYFFIPWISYHHHGKFYIKGGGQALSDACVEVIKENNGAVYLKSEVEKIHVENNVATGITLKNGQQYRAKSIISNINPSDTHRFLPQNSLDTKYEEKLLNSKVGCTLSQLYIGLKCHPKILQIPEDEVFFLGGNSHEEDYELARHNEYERSGFLLTNYNTLDSTLNDENKGVLTVTYLDNYEYWSKKLETYKQQKQEVTDKILKRLEAIYPNFIENVEVLELGTPRTMERYTKNCKGAVYGYAQTVDQAGRHRLKSKTSIHNLWLVGAYVNPGGGYEGSISSGMVAAQAVHRFLNVKKA
ncbi:MAG: phytoene desaturase family protein, partial [Turicibacter sp.]